MNAARTGRTTELAVLAVVAAAAVAPFARTLDAWFAGDDLDGIWDATRERWWSPAGHPDTNWRPLTTATHALNHAVGGLDPRGYHAVELGLHAVASVLVALLTATLVDRWPHADRRGPPPWWAGGSAGLLFALSGSHTEAVAWISARGDLLATVSTLGAVLCWVRLRPGPARITTVAAVTVAGATAKESALVIPVLVMAVEVLLARAPGPGRWRSALRSTRLLWCAAVAVVAVRGAVLGDLLAGYSSERAAWSPWRAPVRMVAGAVRAVLPPLPPAGWSVVAIAAAGMAVVVARRWRAVLMDRVDPVAASAVVVVALAVLAPAATLGVSLLDTRGERLVYLPSAVVAMAVGTALAALALRRATMAVALTAAVAAGGAVATWRGTSTWVDAGALSERLAASACTVLPRDRPARLIAVPDRLGGAYVARNSLGALLELACGWGPDRTPASEVLTVAVARVDDAPRLVVLGPRRWRLDLPPGAELVDVPETSPAFRVPGVEVERTGSRSARIAIGPTVDPASLWVVEAGRLRPVPEAGR